MEKEKNIRMPNNQWWKNTIIYEIYVPSFKDSNRDGFGDLKGVIEKLDYLSSTLGVDTIWLTPFFKSGMKDGGYDIIDFNEVDKIFGDLKTFDELILQAHSRDMKVLIDFVGNHTSDQHPWFIESSSSRNNEKRNWYVWAGEKSNGKPPNNWISVSGGSAWEWDEATREYYLHSHLKEQPDLNWRNPDVKNAMLEVIKFWLSRGVDGLRIDAAERLMKDPIFKNNPANPNPPSNKDFNSQLHIYDKGHQDIFKLYSEIRSMMDLYDNKNLKFVTAEIHTSNVKEWLKYFGNNSSGLHSPCSFALMRSPWNANSIKGAVEEIENSINEDNLPTYCLGNHDSPRIAYRFGSSQARIAAMLLLTLRCIPVIYYGDEIGMTDVDIPPEQKKDGFEKVTKGNGRDSSRTPMQWDSSRNGGFSKSRDKELWLPLSPDYQMNNVKTQLFESGSILNFYRELIKYRKNSLALSYGDYIPVNTTLESCYLFLRRFKKQEVLVALNFSHNKQELSLPYLRTGKKVISTYLDTAQIIDLTRVVLRPDEGVIIELV